MPWKTGVTAEVGSPFVRPLEGDPPVPLGVPVVPTVGDVVPLAKSVPESNDPDEVGEVNPEEGEVRPDVSPAVPDPESSSSKAGEAALLTVTVPR